MIFLATVVFPDALPPQIPGKNAGHLYQSHDHEFSICAWEINFKFNGKALQEICKKYTQSSELCDTVNLKFKNTQILILWHSKL